MMMMMMMMMSTRIISLPSLPRSVWRTIEGRHEVFRKYYVTNTNTYTAIILIILTVIMIIILDNPLNHHRQSYDNGWKYDLPKKAFGIGWVCRFEVDQKLKASGNGWSALSWESWEKNNSTEWSHARNIKIKYTAQHDLVKYRKGSNIFCPMDGQTSKVTALCNIIFTWQEKYWNTWLHSLPGIDNDEHSAQKLIFILLGFATIISATPYLAIFIHNWQGSNWCISRRWILNCSADQHLC